MQDSRYDLEWNDLALILAIGRTGGLSGAARQLGKAHSTIFRRINAIEDKTGVRFFDRFDNGYVLTDAGRTAMKYAERVEGEFHALGLEILGQDTKLVGRLRLTCPEAFAEEHAPGLVARFIALHPDIQVDVIPGHGAADLNRREAEIAIRATKAPPETSFGRKICAFRFALYATESYMSARPDLPLPDHRFCLIEGTLGWLLPRVWKTAAQGEGQVVFQSRASRAVQNVTAENLGVGFLPCYVGDADPRLIRVCDPIQPLDLQLWVLTHPDLRNTARIRAMMSFLYDTLGQQADLWGGARKATSRWNFLPRSPENGS